MTAKRIGVGLSVLVVLILLAGSLGCKSATTSTTTTKPVTTAAATTAKPATTTTATAATTTTVKPTTTTAPAVPTGTLTVVLASLQDENLNPLASIGASSAISSPAYDYLFYRDTKTGVFIPGLAASGAFSADALTVTMNLRKGVQFNEGWGEFTSADVRFLIETLRDNTTGKFARTPQWKAGIVSIDTPDAYTVVVKWNKPQLDFIDDLTVGMAFGVPSSKYVQSVSAAQAAAHPVGTGPYVFDSSSAGAFIKYKAAATAHWRVGVPSFQYIVIKAAAEEATRVAMLQTGQADLAPISLDSVAKLQSAGLKIIGIPQAYTSYIALGGQVPADHQYYDAKNPMQNKDVRQALNLAVNKTEMINTIYRGTAVASSSPYPIKGWEAFQPYPYDPAKAKQLLAQAGFSGFTTELRMNAIRADSNLMAAAVAQYWTAIGVNVKLVNQDYATMRASAQTNNTTGWNWTFGYAPRYDWESIMTAMHTSKGGKWSTAITPKLESLSASISGLADMTARNKIYTQIVQEVVDGYHFVPVAVPNETWGTSKQVGAWTPPPGMSYMQTWETVTRSQ